jgi:prolyl oligopeptidase
MKAYLSVFVLAGSTLAIAAPPVTESVPVSETIHGDTVVDEYRWLEGDNSNADNMGLLTEEVTAWTDDQNGYTRSILDNLPGRTALEERLRE